MKIKNLLLVLSLCYTFLFWGCYSDIGLPEIEYQSPIKIYLKKGKKIESSILYNNSVLFQGVECNSSIEILYDESIDISNLKVNILNQKEEPILSRIENLDSPNKLLLIPGEMMKPDRKYFCEIKGLKNSDGTDFSNIHAFKTKDLDYGLYFFGEGNNCEKYIPGVPNHYYDPTMPIVVLAMGWSPGKTARNYERLTFVTENLETSETIHVHKAWREDGWNTGIIFWDQFSDELNANFAEAKIWSFDGPKKSRYRLGNGNYKNFNRKIYVSGNEIKVDSVGEIIFHVTERAFAENTSGNIRLVGYSMGIQLAIILAKSLKDSGIAVNRIAILDPHWSLMGKKYLGDSDGNGQLDWTGEICKKYILEMIGAWKEKNNFAVELYDTSLLGIGVGFDKNLPLRKEITCISIKQWFLPFWNVKYKHSNSKYFYFWNYKFAPPVERNTGKWTPSAKMPNWKINEMMGSNKYWEHVEGRETFNGDDDVFELRPYRFVKKMLTY